MARKLWNRVCQVSICCWGICVAERQPRVDSLMLIFLFILASPEKWVITIGLETVEQSFQSFFKSIILQTIFTSVVPPPDLKTSSWDQTKQRSEKATRTQSQTPPREWWEDCRQIGVRLNSRRESEDAQRRKPEQGVHCPGLATRRSLAQRLTLGYRSGRRCTRSTEEFSGAVEHDRGQCQARCTSQN